jgi:hypothetical protein
MMAEKSSSGLMDPQVVNFLPEQGWKDFMLRKISKSQHVTDLGRIRAWKYSDLKAR